MKFLSHFLLLLSTTILHGTQVSNSSDGAPSPSTILRDEPVQLVRPDFEHRRLQLLDENVDLLNSVQGAVAVVAVVGPFHSGKSFLMNQLMGKSRGFGIGKYVDPMTMGIWMWGRPLEAETAAGEKLSIIFLDTEGFSARNVSELYDAKVFAVASLLSSFLLYNSVKIINQDDLEYLELLARRTRLFALQAQINKAAYQQSFDHELLSFPPLIWVVQDFVQAPKPGESPTDWLRKLVASSMKENQNFDLSLSEIFADLHCHTLFLPTADKHLLQDLSLANESDLTRDFKEERDQLKLRITANIRPKMKNGSPIRGPELATLLRVLVSASNDGSLPEVPGRWRAFLDQMKDSSKQSCLRYYDAQLKGFKEESGNRPLNTSLLLGWHVRTLARTEALFQELLLGYSELVAAPLRDLREKLEAKFAKEQETNLKRIRARCVEERQQRTISAEGMLASLELPQRMEELREYIEFVKRECYKDYWAALTQLSDVSDVKTVSGELLAAIDEVAVGFVRENLKRIGELYASAIQAGVSAFRSSTSFKTKDPLTSPELKRVAETAEAEARKTAEVQVDPSLDKGSYSEFLSQLSTELEGARKELQEENDRLLAAQCQDAVSTLKMEFIGKTGPDQIAMPVFREELLSLLQLEENRLRRAYTDRFALFPDSAPVAEYREKLNKELGALTAQREQENLDALTREVSIPLGNAVSIIKLSAARYDSVYEFRQFVTKVCEIELEKGKANAWSQEMRRSVIENYVSQDKYIQQEISSNSEKKIHSGRVNGVDPGFSDPLEELKRDPIAAGERFKRAAEALSGWSKRYEAGMHMKTKRLQESVTHAQHDLGILKDELHKARSALSASQTGSNVLMGKLQMLEEQNLSLKNDLSRGVPGDTDFSNEETQLLIADLRSQIVKLKSEVPDPNFIESLRLITQLLQEDKKMLEKKYTEVSEELHNRDNEISRLIKENQTNGSLIPEGQTGLEKHFNFQLEELRRQNQSLRQQLQISQHKLEVSEKRETAENEPGPSKVELQNMIQHANEFRAQLQEKMDEKEGELRQLKIQLESSREVMSGSSTRDVNSFQRNWVGPDEEGKLKEQVLGMELDKQHLENALSERERTVEGFERELRMEKGKVHELEGRIRQLETPVMDSNQDNGKDSLIETLLATRNSLTEQNDALQKERDELASLKDGVPMMRNWLESRDAHIKQLTITIDEKSQECAHFKRQYEQFNLRSAQLLEFGNQVNEEKVQLESVLHKYKQRIEELEGKLSSIHSLSPSMTTAAEVYDVQVMQLSKELQASDQEKRNAVEKFSELESKNEKLVQQLHDMSVECANLKNMSSAGGGRYNFAYPGYHPEARYPVPYPPRPPPAHGGHGGHGPMQGRDSGVPYS